MDKEYNKIDDIFRKGLEGAAEQPPAGLWRKISGRLFWKEVIRFNFTNLSAGWTSMVAAGIVAGALLVYNLTPTVTEKGTNQNSTGEKTGRPNQVQQIEYPPSGEKVDYQQKAGTVAIVENDTQNSAKNLSSDDHSIQEKVPVNMPSNPLNQQNKSSEIAQNHQNTAIDATKTQNVEQPSKSKTGHPAEIEQTESHKTLAATVNPESSVPSGIRQQPSSLEKSEKVGVSPIKNEENLTTEQVRQQLEISQLEKRKLILNPGKNITGINQYSNSDDLLLLTEKDLMNNTERSLGKIQKMHTLSFTIGKFLQGKYKPPQREYEDNLMDKYRGNNHILSIAAYFAPEMTDYSRMASSSREQNCIGGLAMSYNSARYLLQGGVELSYSNDLGDYMVNMRTFDSTGYYNNIGSFTIDPDNPDSVIFNTNTVAVWDSVHHQSLEQTQNHYTYLQFPFMVGYKAMESGVFSAYIKAGPCFSFLLNRQEPRLNYFNPDATIQNIDNFTPTRLNASIQILVSLSLQFQISDNIGIMVEPTYRYYLRSVYDVQGGTLKNPYGIGVRGGVFYNF